MITKIIALFALIGIAHTNVDVTDQPNVIIMIVNNLEWNDLGIHVNQKDSENSTPNLDYLAYSGTILNRFYANGGLDSLLSGCHQRSKYANTNLLSTYFKRNGYNVDFTTRNTFEKLEDFEKGVLGAISENKKPFLHVIHFGDLGSDIKIPFIDEIVGSVVMKTHKNGLLGNTIIWFLSLPDNESPLEINIRRTAFVYSPLLKLQSRVSNQIVHVIDLLPTLVNATDLKWRTRDRIFIDGISQWTALNTNDEERLEVYGNNFYIDNYWKLTFGVEEDSDSYQSKKNENMDAESDAAGYNFATYIHSLFTSESSVALSKLSSQKIVLLRNRAKVHCNLKDMGESAVENIKCSRLAPCLFNLLEDPCEFDEKHEPEFQSRRNHMKNVLERHLSGESITENPVIVAKDDTDEYTSHGGTPVGVTMGIAVLVLIIIFIIIVCIKEKCNNRRSVYHDKEAQRAEKKNRKLQANGNSLNEHQNDPNAISVISKNVK